MNQLPGARLILPKPQWGTCHQCGDTFPLGPSDSAESCKEWADMTVKKLSSGIPFDTLLNLKMIGKLCYVIHAIQSGLATLDEAENRR